MGGDGHSERGDYVNDMKRCRVCRSRVSPCGSPFIAPSPPLPLCRMSDPVSEALQPAWERHEAFRHKHNTDKNTRHAMCRPVSQDSAEPLSPVSPYLCFCLCTPQVTGVINLTSSLSSTYILDFSFVLRLCTCYIHSRENSKVQKQTFKLHFPKTPREEGNERKSPHRTISFHP